MNYMNFRNASYEEKLSTIISTDIDQSNFIYELYYFSHHDEIYKKNKVCSSDIDEKAFFRNHSIIELKTFIDKMMCAFNDSTFYEEKDIISFYCLILSMKSIDAADKSEKEKYLNILNEKYTKLFQSNKIPYNVQIMNKGICKSVINVAFILNVNESRNDISFEEIPEYEYISIGYEQHTGSSLPYVNILNINSHTQDPEQRGFFNYNITAKELYENIRKNKATIIKDMLSLYKSFYNKLNYINENKKFILADSIESFKNKNYYSSLLCIISLIEDIFKNIIYDDLASIILEKYKEKKYDKKTFILNSPPMLNDTFKKIIQYKNDIPYILNQKYSNLDYNLILNFEIILKSRYGLYVRNSIMHGNLSEEDFDYEGISAYLIYLVLCLCYY